MGVSEEKLFFKPIKTHCGWYISEYRPPIHGHPFATLQLTFLEDPPLIEVAQEMEEKLDHWTSVYPVSLMVSAFDKTSDLLNLETVRESSHLIGVVSLDDPPKVSWTWGQNYKFPVEKYTNDQLTNTYADLSFNSQTELREKAIEGAKKERIGWLIFSF